MGATFFMLFMAILFITALFFAGISIIWIIIWNIKKKSSKSPKKRYAVIPTILLTVSLIIALLPVGVVLFLRTGNSANAADKVKAESGEIIYWGTDENGDATTGSFEWNGVKYIDIGYGSSDTWELGEAVANLKFESSESGINKFMETLFAYDGSSTLYPVKNDEGFNLYTTGSWIYVSEEEAASFNSYYDDLNNYDTTHCTYSYSVYGEADTDGNAGLDSVSSKVTLPEGVYDRLWEIGCAILEKVIEFELPEECLRIAAEEKPGTPYDGFPHGELTVCSNDKVMAKSVWLGFIEGQAYVLKQLYYGDGTEPCIITAYPLSEELGDALAPLTIEN